jgi:hypothetical protein
VSRGRFRPRLAAASIAARRPEPSTVPPIVLFGIQFTFCLIAYALIASWYVAPRLSRLPRAAALVPLLWVHAFRVAGATILAPGAVDAAVPMEFRTMVGLGDLTTAILALVAIVALHRRMSGAIGLVWVCLIVGAVDTVNAVIQSIRFDVFSFALGANWLIVTMYVPALVVSSVLILLRLLDRTGSTAGSPAEVPADPRGQEGDGRLGRAD